MGFTVASETAGECRAIKDTFADLPRERVWGEFAKPASRGTRPSLTLEPLHQTGWEEHIPSLAAVRHVLQDPAWHPEGPVHAHLGMSADSAAAIADRGRARQLGPAVRGARRDAARPWQGHPHPAAEDRRITSHDHAQAGVAPARDFLARIGAPGHIQ